MTNGFDPWRITRHGDEPQRREPTWPPRQPRRATPRPRRKRQRSRRPRRSWRKRRPRPRRPRSPCILSRPSHPRTRHGGGRPNGRQSARRWRLASRLANAVRSAFRFCRSTTSVSIPQPSLVAVGCAAPAARPLTRPVPLAEPRKLRPNEHRKESRAVVWNRLSILSP